MFEQCLGNCQQYKSEWMILEGKASKPFQPVFFPFSVNIVLAIYLQLPRTLHYGINFHAHNNQMQQKKEVLCKTYVYILMDILFAVFAVLYMIGDTDHYNITALRCAKPIPLWIMMAELYTVHTSHKNIKSLMIAMFFGSLGDILLEFQTYSFAFFATGALSFLVGHTIYVISFLQIAEDVAEGQVEMREILKLKPLYIIGWAVFFVLSFWSIGTMMRDLAEGSIMMIVLPVYGTFLVMLVMGGCFNFFMTFRIKGALKAGLCFMLGSLVFYASDSFLSHGKFDNAYMSNVSVSANAAILMVTYYVAQYLMGKGGLAVAQYFLENKVHPEQEESTPDIVHNNILRNG